MLIHRDKEGVRDEIIKEAERTAYAASNFNWSQILIFEWEKKLRVITTRYHIPFSTLKRNIENSNANKNNDNKNNKWI